MNRINYMLILIKTERSIIILMINRRIRKVILNNTLKLNIAVELIISNRKPTSNIINSAPD